MVKQLSQPYRPAKMALTNLWFQTAAQGRRGRLEVQGEVSNSVDISPAWWISNSVVHIPGVEVSNSVYIPGEDKQPCCISPAWISNSVYIPDSVAAASLERHSVQAVSIKQNAKKPEGTRLEPIAKGTRNQNA